MAGHPSTGDGVDRSVTRPDREPRTSAVDRGRLGPPQTAGLFPAPASHAVISSWAMRRALSATGMPP